MSLCMYVRSMRNIQSEFAELISNSPTAKCGLHQINLAQWATNTNIAYQGTTLHSLLLLNQGCRFPCSPDRVLGG
jgi:hypothetical protein